MMRGSKSKILVTLALVMLLMLTLSCRERAGTTSPPAPASEPTQALTPVSEAHGIKLIGAITETITLTYFAEGAKSKCHGTSVKFIEQDGKTSVYTGIPLWLMCGWVDDDVKHGGDAFNDDLAANGYRVVVTAADGRMVVFDSKLIARNDNIVLANKVGVKSIEGYPTLVSSEPGHTLKLENVVEIRLEFE
ncbi:MAG: hypothetical protein DRI26_01865 [Chloroflexi bacterium]|nr:MAG: hypothetical protein DRI26_01865 [Chloroflexota bacterium]